MANEQNLIPLNERTKSEQRAIATAGGKASGKARRNKKLLRDCIDYLLEREDKMVLDAEGNPMSGAEQLAYNLFVKALGEPDTAKAARAFDGEYEKAEPLLRMILRQRQYATSLVIKEILNGNRKNKN